MTIPIHHPRRSETEPTSDPLARAWTASALIPVFFVVGFAVGELLYAVLGFKPENDDAPLWADLVVSLAALAVTLVPCVGAVVYARRASEAGRHQARVPMAIGALAGAVLVILTAANL